MSTFSIPHHRTFFEDEDDDEDEQEHDDEGAKVVLPKIDEPNQALDTSGG
jgi:hypothetical protein